MYGKEFFARGREAHRISFDREACVGCAACVRACPMCQGVDVRGERRHARAVCRERCLNCYLCVATCPAGAIKAVPVQRG